jgi:hypothetical protein
LRDLLPIRNKGERPIYFNRPVIWGKTHLFQRGQHTVPGGLLGDSEGGTEDERSQSSWIEQALRAMQGLLADYEAQGASVRQRAQELKSRALSSIGPVTVVVSLACSWIALSQGSVLRYTRACGRRS